MTPHTDMDWQWYHMSDRGSLLVSKETGHASYSFLYSFFLGLTQTSLIIFILIHVAICLFPHPPHPFFSKMVLGIGIEEGLLG